MFYSRFPPLYFCLLYFHAAFCVNTTPAPRNAKTSDNLEHIDSVDQRTGHTGYKREGLGGFEPGDPAPAFQVQTLDGVFIYSPQNDSRRALIVHAFTNKSAFLECLWTWSESLSDLLEYLPASTEVLLLSLDDTAVQDAFWMREQVYRAAAHRGKEILSRLHFSPTPVCALGNWIPRVLYSWGCGGHNCGLAQVIFSSPDWRIPVISKRLNARYDWLNGRWGADPYRLLDAGDGCEPVPSVKGAVAWVSEGGCSFFTKIKNMAESNATGVLVYALPGNPIQDMNCLGDDCSTSLNIPASMVHIEPSVIQALRKGRPVNVTFQITPSPNFFFAIDQKGALSEMGWFLYPTFRFMAWQAQWFIFNEALREQLGRPAVMVPVFDRHLMHGDTGAQAVVDLPADMLDYDVLELDASLSCPGRRDETCAHWDHTVQLYICCDQLSPYCNLELGRWITAFRRGTGHWLTDVSPLIPLLNDKKCTFTMKTAPWAMPWMTSVNLRFSHNNQTGNYSERLYPFKVMPLFMGGTFDKDYNSRYQEIKFSLPASTKKVELYAVITAHGSDENFCGEFCVTSHHFLINRAINNTLVFESAGSPLGCAMRVPEGGVPNEHGTWLYGRGGWCDGLQVDPWRTDITSQGYMSGGAGYVLSREALKRFVEGFSTGRCKHFSSTEDVALGRCMEIMGVEARDSRDSKKRETFNPFRPEKHLDPKENGKQNLFYSDYKTKRGPDCCADFVVSFHYLKPADMYMLEYYAHHLRPFGYKYIFNPNHEQSNKTTET